MLGSRPRLLAPDQQHRAGRQPYHAFGHAAEQQMVQAAPAVRAHYQQFRGHPLGLVHDHLRDVIAGALELDQPRLDMESLALGLLLRLFEQLLSVLSRLRVQLLDIGRRRSRSGLGNVADRVDDVQQPDLSRWLMLPDPDRFAQRARGCVAAVDGYHDAFVHGAVLLYTGPRVTPPGRGPTLMLS